MSPRLQRGIDGIFRVVPEFEVFGKAAEFLFRQYGQYLYKLLNAVDGCGQNACSWTHMFSVYNHPWDSQAGRRRFDPGLPLLESIISRAISIMPLTYHYHTHSNQGL